MRRAAVSMLAVMVLCLAACTEEKKPPTPGGEPPKGKQPLVWKELPALPAELGLGGLFAGTSKGSLIVAGGANFPTPLTQGGTKVWHDAVYVLEPGEKQWHTGFKLPRPLAYGVSVSTNDGFCVLGGCDADTCFSDCLLLKWAGGKIETAALPRLPKPCAFTSGAVAGKTLYVAGGQESPKATAALKNFWALDLSKPGATWQDLKPWPGPGRILPVAAAREDSFYLFSGASLKADEEGKASRTFLKDAYRYDPMTGWTQLAEMPRPAVAAPTPAMAFGVNRILIFSGDDGANVGLDPKDPKTVHPGFPTSVLAYDVQADVWSTLGELPAAHVTTALTYWQGMAVMPSGEIRPGIRSPKVYGVRAAK